MKYLILSIMVMLSSCQAKIHTESQPLITSNEIYPEDYKCDGMQLNLVIKETEICKTTGYFDTYCFAQAKKSQCTKI